MVRSEGAVAVTGLSNSPKTRFGWAARILTATGALAFFGQVVAMFYAGIGWDGRMDAGQSVVIRQVIPALPPGTSLQEAYDRIHFTAEFYGILIPQLGDLFHYVIMRNSALLTLNELATYRWQGFANIVVFTAAMASLSIAVGMSLRSRLAGAYTWALTMTTPMLFGMSFINIKDLPVASGLTLVSAGLMVAWTARSPGCRWWLGGAFMVLGSCIGIASRPGFWPVFGFLALGTFCVLALVSWRSNKLPRLLPIAVLPVISAPITLIFLWWSNPFGRMALFPWLWDSFSVMRNYPWQGTIRTAGQDLISTELPWWYAPAWLLAQLPIATTLVILAGLVLALAGTMRRTWGASSKAVISFTPLFLQALVIPVMIILGGAILYDAIRHLVFAVPALIAISSLAIVALERRPDIRLARASTLAGAVGLVVVLLSSWATLRWFPYSYAFINPVAGINQPERDWELDYWGVTSFEGVDRLQQSGLEWIAVLPSEEPAGIFGGGALELARTEAGQERYGLYVFKRWDYSVGDCERLFAIQRDGQVLGEGAVCNDGMRG